jgi:CheY-like chemotaxis protein
MSRGVPRLRLIHWNAKEAEARSAALRQLGYTVISRVPTPPALLRELSASPPAAVVIDLARAPSQGRDLGILLRQRKGTRFIPLVFVGGEREKVARLRTLLPDATCTEWRRIGPALRRAIAHPPTRPVVPDSVFAAYAGQPLARRLAIKPGARLALIGAPTGFKATLHPMPDGVQLSTSLSRPPTLVLWFVRRPMDLQRDLLRMIRDMGEAHLWIAWPKGGSAARGELTQQAVRQQGLAAGLVDYKICSIDATWSALLFRRRSRPK